MAQVTISQLTKEQANAITIFAEQKPEEFIEFLNSCVSAYSKDEEDLIKSSENLYVDFDESSTFPCNEIFIE